MSISLPASHVPHSPLILPVERTLGPWNRCLFKAVEQLDLEAAQWALSKGAEVNVHCPFEASEGDASGASIIRGGYTPLHDACWANGEHVTWPQVKSMVDLLLDAGADPNRSYEQINASLPPFTPLDLATLNRAAWASDLCAWLCKRGAQPTALTVLTVATESAHYRSLLDLFFSITPVERHRELLAGRPLAKLAGEAPQTGQQVDRMVALVHHGASLTERHKGQRWSAQELLQKNNPDRFNELQEQLQPPSSGGEASAKGTPPRA